MMTKRKRRDFISACLFIVPALCVFLTFKYYPLLMTLYYSFTDWNGFNRDFQYVGFQNFINIFHESKIYGAFLNTIYFAVISILAGTVIQLGLALILVNKLKGNRFFRTILYIPSVISSLIISLTWISFFQYNGIINRVLESIGLEMLIRDWLADVDISMNVLAAINVWQWAGYGMIIYITGLLSIPTEVNEAASLDGATGWRKFVRITLPLIMPAVTVNMFISVTGALKVFELPFVLTGGGPMNSTNTVTMQIYNTAFLSNQFGYASSIGLTFFIFIATLTLIQLRITRRMEVEY
ncbi:carbohydrate ABC transporter permease [Paenibacillus nasutitermitis]|uniref:Sugar ABC transporter permease n=1 Tax=Paenibacillus nasutitermitis TaxID=1652958 RepID=A0A916YV34_9BACL|nr:sugar ABC transporter permease [Paenibacillus nasutitermitis]GGD62171.1 sugar ABC transporter permease [Paenibacillus nasutitermitis]